MIAPRIRYTKVFVVCVLAAFLSGCVGRRNAVDESQGRDTASLLREAVDRASPNAAIPICPRLIRGQGRSVLKEEIYHYDYDEIDRLEKRYRGVSRATFLRAVFARAVKGHENGSDNEKWLAVINYLSTTMRHPPIEQPMYPDGTVVWDPLILLELHEGRCGHIASIIVDLALANHYEARRVQLAAHLVAEVKWGGSWHWVDADAGFPIDSLRSHFAELPSLEQLARNPYVLDSMPARNWEWAESWQRTVDGLYEPRQFYYPGNLTTSSTYFGRQIFTGVFGGRTATKQPAIIYCYKQGTAAQWQTDRYYGWDHLREVTQPVPAVPLAYMPVSLTISAPSAVYADKEGRAVIPVRWAGTGWPVCQPDQVRNCKLDTDNVAYEVRVSTKTRGWDYDFRDYDFMPRSGTGDLLITRNVRKIDDMSYGIDVPVHDVSGVFIEVDPIATDKTHKGDFMWPSNELRVRVVVPWVTALQKSAGAGE